MAAQLLNASVIRRIDVAEGLAIFRILPDFGVPDFSPGQYVALGLPGTHPRPLEYPPEKEVLKSPEKLIKRSYSIGSSPFEKDYLEFYIAIVPEGALTSRIALLSEGGRIWIAPKIVGRFGVDGVPKGRNLVLIATGTGIAPYISMLRTDPIRFEYGRIILIHGVRYESDLAYDIELENLKKIAPNFSYYSIVSRPSPNWSGHRGYVQDLIKNGIVRLDSSSDHVFLCGNPAMIDDVQGLLAVNGYTEHSSRSPGNLHLEKYW